VELGHEVVGVDGSPEMLDLARDRVPQARFLEGDLGDLPVEDGNFDLAVCALALGHAEDLRPPIAELAPLTVQGHKQALNLVAHGVDAAAIDELRELEERAFASRDLQEGLAAFSEKRSPRFEGR
jgi:SAM-dependent methyltransferase